MRQEKIRIAKQVSNHIRVAPNSRSQLKIPLSVEGQVDPLMDPQIRGGDPQVDPRSGPQDHGGDLLMNP